MPKVPRYQQAANPEIMCRHHQPPRRTEVISMAINGDRHGLTQSP
ncbi:MAG: hypothetical protein WBA57_07045 [Elainellaceae cyanobacterium]